jgi:uncharacterized membrane protein
MRNRFITFWDQFQSNYWFIPAIMSVLAILLSIASIKLDEWIVTSGREITILTYIDSPEGARAVLSTIASSMITIAGVVFSLLMVVLSITSQQYGSFVLTNFMRDYTNQFVLGVFTATFLYCLLILRTIHGVGDSIFVPHISILIGLGLALASIAVLTLFIHHVAYSIQSSTIIKRLGNAMLSGIEDLFPTKLVPANQPASTQDAAQHVPSDFEMNAQTIHATEHGYVQTIDEARLVAVAQADNVLIKLQCRPGDFVATGEVLALVWPSPTADVLRHLNKVVNDAFIIGSKRTESQDIEMLFNSLNQVAIRALSAAINDPFTAVMCIDRLGEGLTRLAQQHIPSPYGFDKAGKLRLIVSVITFEDILSASFTHIYHYGKSDVKIVCHLLKTLQDIGAQTTNAALRAELYQYAVMIRSNTKLDTAIEEQQLEKFYAAAVKTLDTSRREALLKAAHQQAQMGEVTSPP